SNPNRRPAASRTRMPSGTTSLPIPSPGIAAMRCFIEALRALSFVRNGALAYQESASGHTRGPVFPYPVVLGFSSPTIRYGIDRRGEDLSFGCVAGRSVVLALSLS